MRVPTAPVTRPNPQESTAMKTTLLALIPVVLVISSSCAAPAKDAGPSTPEAATPAPAPSLRLEGPEWSLVDVGGKAPVAGLGSRKAFVSFDVDAGSLRGNSGLNSFFGPYALDGSKLRIENLAMTRMAGPPELMEQETAFVAALHAARSWRLDGHALLLLDEKGVQLARFAAMR